LPDVRACSGRSAGTLVGVRIIWRPTAAGLTPALVRAGAGSLTYPEVTATEAAELPSGYGYLHESTCVGKGRPAWERLCEALLSWELHREAQMILATSRPCVEVGCTVVNAAAVGPVALIAPCRVVALVDQPGSRGFAYGTLPGHPLTGEEQFTVELRDDASVHLRIRSFSRPVGIARVSPRLARVGQRAVNRRYAAAARRLCG
jgi:uncharacterized protein (UPF0548 family)